MATRYVPRVSDIPRRPPPRSATFASRRLQRPGVGHRHYRVAAVLIVVMLVASFTLYKLDSISQSVLRAPAPTAPSLSFPTPIRHLIILFMENHPRGEVLHYAPFQRYLAEHYATTSGFNGETYNSLADYMFTTSGAYAQTAPWRSVANLIDATGGETWASYLQSMPYPCDANYGTAGFHYVNKSGGVESMPYYNPLHNPFVHYTYVTSAQGANYCADHVLPLSAWYAAVASGNLPNYVFITPDDWNDSDLPCSTAFPNYPPPSSTNCVTLQAGDSWMQSFLSPFLNSTLFQSSAVFVTYDSEAAESPPPGTVGNGNIYTTLVSPFAKQFYTSTVAYEHYNMLTTTEWLLGLGHTNQHDNWYEFPPMFDLFNFGPTYSVHGTVTYGGVPVVRAIVNGSGYALSADSSGIFSLPLSNGTYALSATDPAGGCTSSSTSVIVQGSSVEVNFQLPCA